MTHLRWLLLRPAQYWASARQRARFVRTLTATHGVGPVWSIDGWTLMQVRRDPVHPDWFEAIAGGSGGKGIVLRASEGEPGGG